MKASHRKEVAILVEKLQALQGPPREALQQLEAERLLVRCARLLNKLKTERA